ncbi:MAG: TonB-dependent receptor [Pseudomonadota bacterium]
MPVLLKNTGTDAGATKTGRVSVDSLPYLAGEARSHGETTERALRIMRVLCAVLMLTAAGSLPAMAQDSQSRELERVEIEAPRQRTPPRTPRSDESDRYDDSVPWDPSAADSDRRAGETGAGLDSIMPSLSVVTEKSAISMSSESLPSQVNVLTRQEIERLDVRNFTDLFKKIPGMRSNSYGQGEIGHEIQIRGNAGSHGKDTAVFVDGVPQNYPCTPIAQSDISWLAPEMIDRIEVIKGPFSALYGNFAQAGVINITTKNSEPSPSIDISGASYGGFRAIPIISWDSWYPTPFLVNEYQTIDGYRDNSQIKRFSTFNKGTVPVWNGNLSLSFNYYRSDWGRPGYISLSQVRKRIIPRTYAIDSADGGDQRRWSLALNFTPTAMESGLYLTLFLNHYGFNNFSTSIGSAQTLSHGDRIFYGGRVFYNFVFGDFASLAAGVESRHDNGGVQNFTCVNRQRTSVTKDYGLDLVNRSWFVQAEVKPSETLKFVGGLRGDYFGNNVENRKKPANSGTGYPSIVSPKLGLVITPVKNVNIFGNKGLGFRSPSHEEVSPTSASGKKNFSLEVAKTDSWDVGLNAVLFNCIYLALDYYQTEMEKEVRTVDNQPINIGDSHREGYEVEGRFYASKQINLFANYGWVDAKVKNPASAGQDRVTFVSEHIVKGGIECSFDLFQDIKVQGDIYYEYLSGPPLYFGSNPIAQYAPDFDAYNFRLATEGRHWGLFVAARYQPREYSSDIVTVRDNEFAFCPLPKWDLSGGLDYTF